jgi:hypothetical protein
LVAAGDERVNRARNSKEKLEWRIFLGPITEMGVIYGLAFNFFPGTLSIVSLAVTLVERRGMT